MEGKQLKALLGSLKADRANWESHWQEVSDYVIPNKNFFTRTNVSGEKKTITLYDTSAVHSAQLLAGALHSMLTNPTSYWFGLTSGDPQLDRVDSVRHWLDKSARKIHHVLNNSNFQTEIHEVYIDLVSIGTAALSIEEDDESLVRFSAKHLSKVYLMENNKGLVDTLVRCYEWTLKQCVEDWPDTLPEDFKKMAESEPNKKVEIIHAVYPRAFFKEERSEFKDGMRYASCYYIEHKGELVELEESGFRTYPYACPRWAKSTGEVYGRGPGMNSLADIKMINEMMLTTLRSAQKAVDPPLMAPDDGFVRKITLKPAGVNYFRAGSQDRIEPLLTNPNVDFGYQVMEDVRRRIREAFYVDQLQLAQGPQMTATEVMQRTEEKLRLMGPVLGRQHHELLKPLIDRVFDILQRKGAFDKPPRELIGKNIDVQYTSAIAKVQQSSEIVNIQKAIAAVAPVAQFSPESLDLIDGDESVRHILKMSGVPTELLRDEEDVEEMRSARADAQNQQIKNAQAQQQAEIANKMAPALTAVSQASQSL